MSCTDTFALGMKRPLTEAERRDLLARYAAGENVLALAAAFDVHPRFPRRLAKARGLPCRAKHITANEGASHD